MPLDEGYQRDGVGGALPSVATYSALPDSAREGTTCWVIDRGREFRLVGGDWQSTYNTDPRWASAAIAISSSGDDSAPGSLAAPIRTTAEWRSRVARLPVQGIVLTILDSLNETTTTLGGACDGDPTRFVYITAENTATVALTTTISAVTPWSLGAASNVVGTITATGLTAYAGTGGNAGALFRIPATGAWGVLGAVESGSAVQYVPPISGPMAVDTVTPQVGQTIEVVVPPHITNKLIIEPNTNVALVGLSLGSSSHAIQVGAGSKLYLSCCKVNGGVDVLQAGSAEITGCACNDSLRTEGDGEGGGARLSIRGCHTRNINNRPAGSATISDLLMRGYLSLESMSNTLLVSGFVFCDPGTSGALVMGRRAMFDAAGVLNGRNAISARVSLTRGAMFMYSQKPNITGTGTEFDNAGTTGTFSALPSRNTNENAFIIPR